jgi:hypothetical protein
LPAACPLELQLTIRTGPVVLGPGEQASIDHTEDLWDGTSAHEQWNSAPGGANYVVTISKAVTEIHEIDRCERLLCKMATALARAWIFSGGSHLPLTATGAAGRALFELNTEEVRRELLAAQGLTPVRKECTMHCETGTTYSAAPLRRAAAIARACDADKMLERLLGYYDAAFHERTARGQRGYWYVDLYKVRDGLCKIHGDDKSAKDALRISGRQWSRFGGALNQGVRHASALHENADFDFGKIEELFSIAREWIAGELAFRGL